MRALALSVVTQHRVFARMLLDTQSPGDACQRPGAWPTLIWSVSVTHRIRCTLHRTLVSLIALLLPSTGVRRRSLHPVRPAASGRRLLVRSTAPPHLPPALRQRRRTRSEQPCAADGPLVRPYFLAHERDSIDAGPTGVHGHPLGAPAIPGMAVLGMGTAA